MDEKRAMLKLAAHILCYPDDDFFSERNEIESFVKEFFPAPFKLQLMMRINNLYGLDKRDLQELYVETFDHKEKTSLYLTAHEMGDSRKRGVSLIELQQMVHAEGYVRIGGELPDFIPMLFEYLTAVPADDRTNRLTRRLACASKRILQHLDREHPYAGIFEIIMERVFDSPTDEDIKQFTKEREEADLEPLPYPIMYQ